MTETMYGFTVARGEDKPFTVWAGKTPRDREDHKQFILASTILSDPAYGVAVFVDCEAPVMITTVGYYHASGEETPVYISLISTDGRSAHGHTQRRNAKGKLVNDKPRWFWLDGSPMHVYKSNPRITGTVGVSK
jgi:hypothetical protein